MTSFLPELLRIANANARRMHLSREFYGLKDRLLQQHGQKIGEDVQYIVDKCWTCYGEGTLPAPRVGAYPIKCGHCYGTGVWQHRYVLLDRWQLGPHVFHRPVGRTERRDVTISGLISHEGVDYNESMRAFLCLAVLYDPPMLLQIARFHRTTWKDWWPERALLKRTQEATAV